MTDNRHTWELISDILDVLDKHGYHPASDQHTGRPIGLIGDLARIYEGTQEVPAGYGFPLSSPAEDNPAQVGPAADGTAITVGPADTRTILAALDEAADLKRDRAANCPDCADQSCGNCEFRLRAAHAYDRAAARLQSPEPASRPEPARPPAPGGSPRSGTPRRAAPEPEAGR
jgi:hypothetical protein